MKVALLSLAIAVAILVALACQKETILTQEVIKYVEVSNPDIDLIKYPWALEEVKAQIEECGPGVLEGNDGENKCGHKISVPELIGMKTGLLIDEDWYLDPTIEFFEAKPILAAPQEWNFLKFGNAKDVKVSTQTCGSCWANSSIHALELFIAGHTNTVLNLAEQTLVSRCAVIGSHGDCQGGYMSTPDVFLEVQKSSSFGGGAPLEAQDPYQGKNSSCKFTDAELKAGFKYKIKGAPYVGSSMDHSRFYGKTPRERNDKIEMIKAAMIEKQSPAVAWINAVSQAEGSKPLMTCGSYSGANHMEVIVGWYQYQGEEIADVMNSWGENHGSGGVFGGKGRTQLKWDCGSGRLNRNLGGSARVFEGDTCKNMASAFTGPNKTILLGTAAQIGNTKTDQKCEWLPTKGLSDPNSCNPYASPVVSTEYHLKASTECDEKTGMVLVQVLGPIPGKNGALEPISDGEILTPHGIVKK